MRSLAIAVLLAAVGPASTWGAVLVVTPDGTGDYPTIQAALDAAGAGDVIELADGTFTGDGNRDLDFLGKAVTVRSQSGDPDLCIMDCEGAPDIPHRGFLFVSGEARDAVVEHIRVLHGIVTVGERGYRGGGALCVSSSPTIRGCVFELCGADSLGGAIACLSGSSPAVEECHIERCWGYWGAGIGCAGGSSPVIKGSRFRGNFAVYAGAAILLEGPSTAVVSGCFFDHNSTKMPIGGSGAGILCRSGAAAAIEGCTFFANSSSGYGGSGVSCLDSDADIAFCTFWNNEGAPIQCLSSSPSIRNCTFSENWNNTGSALSCWDASAPLVTNCVAAFGHRGPPVHCDDAQSAPVLSCCDLYGNDGGDWTGCVAGQAGTNGNVSADPMFCDAVGGDFTLDESSPCAPFSPPNPECDLIGAWPVACGPSQLENGSWGALKARFDR